MVKQLKWLERAADVYVAAGMDTLDAWAVAFDLLCDLGLTPDPAASARADLSEWQTRLTRFVNGYVY